MTTNSSGRWTRRELLAHGLMTSAAVAAVPRAISTVGSRMPRIKRLVRREETVLRLGGMGDNFHMSWAADDRQYISVCDGAGWVQPPKDFFNSRLWTLDGSPPAPTFADVAGYPVLIPPNGHTRYYNFATLALDDHIYQFLSTFNVPGRLDGSPPPDLRFVGAKLIYSPDNGRTWRNQDGSMPVRWEAWGERSRETMVFYEEGQEAFSLLSILQMGRNYSDNRDGYVYVYAPNGNTEGTMNELVMFRVPKSRILEREAYEFFSRRRGGQATWSRNIEERGIVHTFPRGWVNKTEHPWAWMPSVTYNAPLGLYMMASWGMATAADGKWFDRPSYLGLWVSPDPWGPWTQVHEETAWRPANDGYARAFAPQIAPKWIAPDGKSFWLVWSDFQEDHQSSPGKPYYAFNTQRVDVIAP
jgi:hypothetical protein